MKKIKYFGFWLWLQGTSNGANKVEIDYPTDISKRPTIRLESYVPVAGSKSCTDYL